MRRLWGLSHMFGLTWGFETAPERKKTCPLADGNLGVAMYTSGILAKLDRWSGMKEARYLCPHHRALALEQGVREWWRGTRTRFLRSCCSAHADHIQFSVEDFLTCFLGVIPQSVHTHSMDVLRFWSSNKSLIKLGRLEHRYNWPMPFTSAKQHAQYLFNICKGNMCKASPPVFTSSWPLTRHTTHQLLTCDFRFW